MKKFLSLFIFFAAVFAAHSQMSFSSVFAKPRELSVIQTKRFDFIFPAESRQTAQILAASADSTYDEICKFLQADVDLRFPVVISPDTDISNAYFMPIPYNRIVLFDCPPQEGGGLDVFARDIEETFAHELAHAISLNIKSKFWRGATRIFGDIANPSAILTMPQMFVEGVSVLQESRGGGGRLNDALSMQILVRAKREKRFPSWQEVCGARDIAPLGSHYIFGGAFSAFIQQKYGLEKFAEFWRESGSSQFFKLTAGIYKKVFKTKIADDWREFAESIEIPPCVEDFSAEILRKGEFLQLDSNGNSFVFADNRRKKVFLGEKIDGKIKFRALFNCDSALSRLSLAKSGRYLAVCTARAQRGNFAWKTQMRIFDLQKRKFLPITFEGVRDGAIFHEFGDKIEVLAVTAAGGTSALTKICLDVGACECEKEFSREFLPNFNVFSPVFLSKDDFAFIVHDDGNFHTINLRRGGKDFRVSFDEKIVPRFLRAPCGVLEFSFNKDAQTARGFLQISDEKCAAFLQENAPILGAEQSVSIFDGLTAYFSRGFYEDSLCAAPSESFFYGEISANLQEIPQKEPSMAEKDVESPQNDEKTDENSENFVEIPYKPTKIMPRGSLIPFLAIENIVADSSTLQNASLGATYWTASPSEAHQFAVFCGYHFAALDAAASRDSVVGGFTYVNSVLPVTMTFRTKADCAVAGRPVLSAAWDASYCRYLQNSWEAIFVNNSIFALTNLKNSKICDNFDIYWSNVRNTMRGFYNLSGTQAGFLASTAFNPANFMVDGNFFAQIFAKFAVPCLLPFENPRNFTLNLPLQAKIFAQIDERSFVETGGNVCVYAFSTEIQRGLSFFPLYFERLTFCAKYSCVAGWENIAENFCGDEIQQSAGFDVFFTLTPILGEITGTKFDIAFNFAYDFFEKRPFFSLGGAVGL